MVNTIKIANKFFHHIKKYVKWHSFRRRLIPKKIQEHKAQQKQIENDFLWKVSKLPKSSPRLKTGRCSHQDVPAKIDLLYSSAAHSQRFTDSHRKKQICRFWPNPHEKN